METKEAAPGTTGQMNAAAEVGRHLQLLLELAATLTARAASTASTASTASASDDAAFRGSAFNRAAFDDGAFDDGAFDDTASPASGGCGGGCSDGPDSGPALVGTPLGVCLDGFTDTGLMEWAGDLERVARVVAALQVQAAGALANHVREGRYENDGIKHPVELLTISLKLGRSEAFRRLRLAEHFLPATDPLTMAVTPPILPVLGSAFFSGGTSIDQALVVSGFTDEARHLATAGRIDESQVRNLEQTLTGYAVQEPPDFLRRIGLRAVNLLDPDGQQPTAGELTAKQGIFFRQHRRGLVHFDGHMTVLQYEKMMSTVAWATNPNKHRDIDTDGSDGSAAAGGDGGGGAAKGGGGTAERDGGGAAADDDGVSPLAGQTSLTDLFNSFNTAGSPGTTSSPAGPAAALGQPREGSWPPDQGPLPQWARGQETTATTTASKNPLGEPEPRTEHPIDEPDPRREHPIDEPDPPAEPDPPDMAGNKDPSPSTNSSTSGLFEDSGLFEGGGSLGQDPVEGWPHVVDGVSVPAPGSGENPDGLDPIDPGSCDEATKDRRTHGQQLLDGILACLRLAANTGALPVTGGMKAQLLISVGQEDLERRSREGKPAGIAFLPYTGPNPASTLGVELCDADVTTYILGDGSEILNVGRTQRLYTAAQRRLMVARDKGCTFPDCTAASHQCEAHHVVPWQDGGETDVATGCLQCQVHHTLIHNGDWTVAMAGGVPTYTPSFRLDPTRTPRQNTYHNGTPHEPANP